MLISYTEGIADMDGKPILFGETGLEALLDLLREAGTPQDIAWLAEQYIEILRKEAQTEEQE
jgi:hypothetical protein